MKLAANLFAPLLVLLMAQTASAQSIIRTAGENPGRLTPGTAPTLRRAFCRPVAGSLGTPFCRDITGAGATSPPSRRQGGRDGYTVADGRKLSRVINPAV